MPGAYLELTKPRIITLALVTVAAGFFMAGEHEPDFPWLLLAHALLGSTLIGGGVNALNQYLERSIDARMKRTAGRPIPSGRVSPFAALLFGGVLAAVGVVHLFFFTNHLTGLLGALTVVSYVFCYTPLKQKTELNTLVGAVPGALPCLMGWAARQNALPVEAWPLFWILFCWQLPHFFAIAWVYKEDYDASGLRMVTRTDDEGRSTGLKVLITSALLFAVSLAPFELGMAGHAYLTAAVVSGLITVGAAFRLYVRRMAGAKPFVSWSIGYLVAIILALIADKPL